MKIVFKDLKHGEIKVIPENLDDIWYLYNIISKGDLVRAVTFRTDEQKDDKIRTKKSSKKRMKLGIRVSEIKFHEFSDRLRIHGTIEEGPQDLGSFHTLNVDAEKMEKISIIKEEWKHHQIKRLEEAVKQSKNPLVLFVSLDDDNATIAVLRQSGIQKITDVDSNRSGKMYENQSEETSKEYFGEVLSIVENNMTKNTAIVVLGPGFTREHFVDFGREKNPSLFERVQLHPTGNSGMNGVHEAIKTGVVKQITKENRVVIETNLIDELFSEIKKNGLATYGEKEVYNALKNGAVEHLLITDEIVRTKKGEKLLELAKETQSDFTIINTMHDAGKKMEGMGGIGALLRYKI